MKITRIHAQIFLLKSRFNSIFIKYCSKKSTSTNAFEINEQERFYQIKLELLNYFKVVISFVTQTKVLTFQDEFVRYTAPTSELFLKI